jgi:hypothetical protein
MKSHSYPKTIITLALALIASFAIIGLQTPNASATGTCPLTFEEPADVFEYANNGTLEFSEFKKQNGRAAITVTNNSDCDLPLALGSYKMMSGNELSEQELHDEHRRVVSAQETRTLRVDLPSCMSQIDLYHDPGQDGVPTPPEQANANLIGFTFSGNEKDIFAENDIFHFDDGHPYEDLDNFSNDDDDSYRNAVPAEDSRYCDKPPETETCQHPDNQLPIEEPADLFNYVDEGTLEFSQFRKQNGKAAISITNNSNCEFPVALGVYEMFDNTLENQELFSQDTAVIASDSQETVSAKLPACMAQIDLLYDPNEDGPPETPESANPNLIGFTFNQNEKDVFAENDIFHFDDGHPYENLDDFPNDDDDSYRNAGPSSNFCPAESPDPEPEPMTCPFDSTDGTVVNFEDPSIRSDQDLDDAQTNRENVELSAGTYIIKLHGSDQNSDRNNQNQPNESFYLSLQNGETEIVQTPELGDLEDNTLSAERTKTINDFSVSQNITGVRGIHAVYPDNSSPNSLNATCAVFEKQEESEPEPDVPTCPFSESEYDHVITFDNSRIRSDQGSNRAQTDTTSVNLSAGSYKIGMFSYDQYEDRKNANQANEQYFTRLLTANGYITTASTMDLRDDRDTATATKTVMIDSSQDITGIQARHSAFFDKTGDDGSPNSHNVDCIAINQEDTPEPLAGSCSVTPDNPTVGQEVSWSSSASGGTGSYSFDWSGDADGNTQTIERTYNAAGEKTATVEISDGNTRITRTCRVNVSDDSEEDPTRLTIKKEVRNRDGRSINPSDFTITATPQTGNNEPVTFQGSSNGVTKNVSAVRHNLSESGPNDVDYSTSYSGDCSQPSNGGGRVTPNEGEVATCTVVNTLEDDDDDNGGGGSGGGIGGGGAVLDPRDEDDDDEDDDGQVRGRQDNEFSVQCEPENDSYLIGEQVTFTADVSGDIDESDASFDWENGGSNLQTTDNEARVQYVSAGTKSITVTAEYDNQQESDTCSVSIRTAANQSGVRLDQIPYTGPGDTARTIAFGILILLIALSGSYLGLRRFREDMIPVGIPEDSKKQ